MICALHVLHTRMEYPSACACSYCILVFPDGVTLSYLDVIVTVLYSFSWFREWKSCGLRVSHADCVNSTA